MTGQDQILALRRSGRAPVTVWLTDERGAPHDGSTVYVAPDDVPELFDLRFLVGLTVLVDGPQTRTPSCSPAERFPRST